MQDIDNNLIRSRKGFTIAEILTSAFILLYLFIAIWDIYFIGLKWWNEMAPVVEAQRIARVALESIVDGMGDSTAGYDTVDFVTYGFRNGISGITLTNTDVKTNPAFSTPVISAGGRRIDFKLEKDAVDTNPRAFYLGTDAVTGIKALYYLDSAGGVHRINATQGMTDLVIESAAGYSNLIKVTATVQKTVPGTRYETQPIFVEYSDYIYIRSI